MFYENVLDQWVVQIREWIAPFANFQSLTFHTVESINQLQLDRLTDLVEDHIDQIQDVIFLRSTTFPDFLSNQLDRLNYAGQTLDDDLKSLTQLANDYIEELNEITHQNFYDIQSLTQCINSLTSHFTEFSPELLMVA
jgi:phasin family protein